MVEGLATIKTQNEEIIRRLNIQNGRVDKLEAFQFRLVVWMAIAAGGTHGLAKALEWLLL